MTFDEFKIREDASTLLSYLSVERSGEVIETIVIDFNMLDGRPQLNWKNGVLTITFDRTAEGRVQ